MGKVEELQVKEDVLNLMNLGEDLQEITPIPPVPSGGLAAARKS